MYHLFLQSVYDSTGYYEYSSFKNYAYLGSDNSNFTVYDVIGTPKNEDRYFYFTFDGGPSDSTEVILDPRSELGIKATFFVSGGENTDGSEEIIKRIYDEGHTIGIYGHTLPANRLYQSVETYLADFNKEFEYVYSITGEKPRIFRFRNGTVNKYNMHIRKQLTAEMLRRGFVY